MTNFNKKYQAFSSSLNALENYLNKENRNETELKNLQEKADADFVNLNISFYSLNKEVEVLVKNLVFAGTYYDATLTINSLKNILEKFEVKEIEAIDKEFDPSFHQAVMQEEKEGTKENIVIEVLQKGYTYKDKVIRPAMVKVSK